MYQLEQSEQLKRWKLEEQLANMHGWDFSHIFGRYTEETDLPWDYQAVIQSYLQPEWKILDVDTGGGEFLLSLGHPYENTSAAEGYLPNVALCRETLLPLGIDFRAGDGAEALPFPDHSFDLLLNRHGDVNAGDVARLLKPGGFFITEQVGAENDRELVELLLGKLPLPFPNQSLAYVSRSLMDAGFQILDGQECFRPIRFYDVGALVWFARVLPWEFPGFSVDACREALLQTQAMLEKTGCIEGRIHRFLIVARLPAHGKPIL